MDGMDDINLQLIEQLVKDNPTSMLAKISRSSSTPAPALHGDSDTDELSDEEADADVEAGACHAATRGGTVVSDGKVEDVGAVGECAGAKHGVAFKGKRKLGRNGSSRRKRSLHAFTKRMRAFVATLPAVAQFNLTARYDAPTNVTVRIRQLQQLTKHAPVLQVFRDGLLVEQATSTMALAVHRSSAEGNSMPRGLATLVKELDRHFTFRVKELQRLMYHTLPTLILS
jgi:hypothetical protein